MTDFVVTTPLHDKGLVMDFLAVALELSERKIVVGMTRNFISKQLSRNPAKRKPGLVGARTRQSRIEHGGYRRP